MLTYYLLSDALLKIPSILALKLQIHKTVILIDIVEQGQEADTH